MSQNDLTIKVHEHFATIDSNVVAIEVTELSQLCTLADKFDVPVEWKCNWCDLFQSTERLFINLEGGRCSMASYLSLTVAKLRLGICDVVSYDDVMCIIRNATYH